MASASTLLLSSSSVAGGGGGDTCCYIDESGIAGDGGNGLVLDGSSAYTIESSFRGGDGGYVDGVECDDYGYGQRGDDVVLEGGSTLEVWDDTARTVEARGIVQAGSELALIVRGAPGDRVWLPRARQGGWHLVPSSHGALHLRQPLPGRWLYFGEIPASGELERTVPTEEMLGSLTDGTVHYQVIVIDTLGKRWTGEGSHLGVYEPLIR
jgi:hypothetical protein